MHQGEWPWHVDFSGLQALVLTKVYDSSWAAKLLVRACNCLQPCRHQILSTLPDLKYYSLLVAWVKLRTPDPHFGYFGAIMAWGMC